MTIQPQEILEKLQWRYAVKKFDPSKKISEADTPKKNARCCIERSKR